MKRPPRNPGKVYSLMDAGYIWSGLGYWWLPSLTVQTLSHRAGDCIGKPLFSMCYAWARWGMYCHSIRQRITVQPGAILNKLLIIAVLIAMILQFVVTYVPALQSIFKTQALSWKEVSAGWALSSLVFIAVEIEKWLRRKKKLITKI